MKKVLLCALVIFCLITIQVNAQIKWDVGEFMPLSEVKQGMKGKGYTVFFGTTVEEFDLEVVSIEYNFSPGWHVVWAKGTSENFKRTGVAGGMSGSPIYIDGRLMGALSLGYFNQREHANLFGITPIEQMVKVAARGMKPNLRYAGAKFLDLGSEYVSEGLDMVPSLIPENDRRLRQNPLDNSNLTSNSRLNTQENSLRLAIPIALPRLDAATIQILKPVLDRWNMVPVQSAGGGGHVKKSPVEKGQVIGTEYVRGDYTAFGYGTITYVNGNELLAYGHSASGEGNVNLPISGGYVHFINPSTSRSVKIASPTQPIGTLVQDRDPAIAGLIKKLPNTHHYIPVTAKVQTTDMKQHDVYYEVIRYQTISGIYAGIGIANIVNAMEFYGNDHTVNAKATITLKDHPDLDTQEIVIKNIFSSSGSPGINVMRMVSNPMLDLIVNPYAKVKIKSVNLDVKIEDKRRTAQILTARLDKNVYRPGEEVKMTFTLRPYLEQPITLTGTITIPKDTPDGVILLRAMNSGSYQSRQRSRAPGVFSPRNINQLVKLLERIEPNTNIIMELSVPQSGLTVQGEEFSDLPISVMSVMNTATRLGERGYTFGTSLHTNKVETDYIISGSAVMSIAVDRNAP